MDFAPTFTPRVKVGYRSAGLQHTMMFRVSRGTGSSAAGAAIGSLASNISVAAAALMPVDFAYTTFDFAPEDSDVFVPLGGVPSHTTGSIALADYSPVARATETTFKGKSQRSKVSFSLFGMFWDLSDPAGEAGNGRVELGESTVVEEVLSALAAASAVVAIDNTHPAWYPFATVKINDHWLAIVRRTFA